MVFILFKFSGTFYIPNLSMSSILSDTLLPKPLATFPILFTPGILRAN